MFRALGARQHVLCAQTAHCMLLPQAAHQVGGLFVSRRGTGDGKRISVLDCFAWSHLDHPLFLTHVMGHCIYNCSIKSSHCMIKFGCIATCILAFNLLLFQPVHSFTVDAMQLCIVSISYRRLSHYLYRIVAGTEH
jgi:hypothetical protein